MTPPTDAVVRAREELRKAVEAITTCAPGGFADDVREISRRVSWIIEGLAAERTCDDCGATFRVDAVALARMGMIPPTRCKPCRQRR